MDELRSLRLKGYDVPHAQISSLEHRVLVLEDKLDTLVQIVSKLGLVSPEIVELQRGLAEIMRAAAEEAVRTAVVERKQAGWNAAHEGGDHLPGPSAE